MRPRPSEPPAARDVFAAPDPVAAFLAAHEEGATVALATSGTTGAPRRVVRTTHSWTLSFDPVAERTGLRSDSRVWVPGPLTSTMNLFAAVHATAVGATLSGTPEGMTHAHLTPTALARCLDQGVPLVDVRLVVAGDRLDRRLSDRAARAGAVVAHYYGAAELSFVAWGSHADDLEPLPEVETSLRDGLLWVRSPYLCQGYDGPAGPLQWDADGFATIGDRARMDDGYLRVTGRGTDAIVTAGATVLVSDVEDVLWRAVPGEVVAVGLPHPELGQVVAAVLTDPRALAPARYAARQGLPHTHRPRRWFHLGTLPTTTAGKVDRTELVRLVVSPERTVRELR